MSFRNSFGGDRYYPPAAQPLADAPTASDVPLRPDRLSVQGRIVAGKLRATFTPRPGYAWLIRRISVSNTVVGQAVCYEGDVQPQNFVAGTRTGQLDEDDCNQPIFIPEGSALNVVWSGATTGVAWARVEFVEV